MSEDSGAAWLSFEEMMKIATLEATRRRQLAECDDIELRQAEVNAAAHE